MDTEHPGRDESLTPVPHGLGALVELAREPLVVIDTASGRILDVNDAAAAALGADRARLLQRDVDDLLGGEGENAARWTARREQIERGGGRLRFEAKLRVHDGAPRPLDVTARRVRIDGRDVVVATLLTAPVEPGRDVAGRAGMERFRALSESLHVGVIVQDARARIGFANATARELLGLSDDELRGLTSFDPSWNVTHEDGTPFPAAEHPVPRAIATGSPQRQVVMGVYRPRTRDRVWLLVDAEPQMDADARLESVVCTFSDITALKEAERALRVSEARLREAQRIAGVGSFEWTAGSPRVTWSDEMFRIMGTDPARFVPTNEAVLGLHLPDERERVMALYTAAVTSGAPAYEWETRIVRPDGETRDILVRGEVMRDAAGALASVRGTMQDITERKRAERLLAESEERFRRAQKLEAVGRLAGGIAHDFNNMLSPIIGFASSIRARLPQGDALCEPMEIIQEAAERAAALTKQLLAFSRQQVVQPRLLDLDVVLSGLERILHRVLGEDVELKTVLGAGRARVLCDPSQIEQIVLNLAVNARDAMPKGGKLTIETSQANLTGESSFAPIPHVRLSVSDTGTGIDEATRARLFEPFFTTKEPGKGTGLGLATVYAIVKQCQGDVRFETRVGHGTRFDVFLPRHDAEEPEAERASRPTPARPLSAVTILVVEDDALVRRTTSSLLRGEGYVLLEAANGAEALAILEREPSVALLVSDVVMPGMSGLDLVAEARARRPGLAAILVSGYSPDVLRDGPSVPPSVAFLSKPFKASDLFRAVRAALDREEAESTDGPAA